MDNGIPCTLNDYNTIFLFPIAINNREPQMGNWSFKCVISAALLCSPVFRKNELYLHN